MGDQNRQRIKPPKALKILLVLSLGLSGLFSLGAYFSYFRYEWESFRAPINLTSGETRSFEFRAHLSATYHLKLHYKLDLPASKLNEELDPPAKLKWTLVDKAGGKVADKELGGRAFGWDANSVSVLGDSPALLAGHDYVAKITVVRGTGLPNVPVEVSFGVGAMRGDAHTIAGLCVFWAELSFAVSLAMAAAWAVTRKR